MQSVDFMQRAFEWDDIIDNTIKESDRLYDIKLHHKNLEKTKKESWRMMTLILHPQCRTQETVKVERGLCSLLSLWWIC